MDGFRLNDISAQSGLVNGRLPRWILLHVYYRDSIDSNYCLIHIILMSDLDPACHAANAFGSLPR